ncbi:MAG: DUF4382 domain-containing protein [Euryarchaeota archaeon]|nr:DUF4382 domain-containing protein [Euryarchaeota archaeon]
MHHRTILITLLMSITLVLSGCTGDVDDEDDRDTTTGDGDTITPEAEQEGRVVAYVKDAPEDDFHELWVVFTGVHVHRSGDDGNETDGTGTGTTNGNTTDGTTGNDTGSTTGNDTGNTTTTGGWETIWEGENAIDLLRLAENDTRALLGGTELETGRYQQIRLDISEAWGVRTSDFQNVTIEVTTGQAKVVQSFEVSGNGTTELIIDLDLERSLAEQRGGGGGQSARGSDQETRWRLNPVIGSVEVVTR